VKDSNVAHISQPCLCKVLEIIQLYKVNTLTPSQVPFISLQCRSSWETFHLEDMYHLNRRYRNRTVSVFSVCALDDAEPTSPSNLKHVIEYLDSLTLGT